MTEAIKRAIEEHKEASKEYKKAVKKCEKLSEETTRAWANVRTLSPSIFKRKEEQPEEYEKAMQASAAEDKARKDVKVKQAILNAASANAAAIAADALKTAIKESPGKFLMPTHYKKFLQEVNNVIGDSFYLDCQYCVHVYFRQGAHGHDVSYVCSKDNSGLIDLESLAKHEAGKTFPTLKEIKAEAKKAIKDAEKIRKIYAEAERKSNEIRNGYTSNIKYYMPHIHLGLKDDYRFF